MTHDSITIDLMLTAPG